MNNKMIAELVRKAQKGDGNALNDLFAECYNDIYYYILKTVKNEDLAADVTQESFLEIMTTLDKLREPEAFPSWARRIAYHKCAMHFRALHFRNTKEEFVYEENEDGETILDRLPDESEDALPEDVLEDKEFRQTIMGMINSLPSEQTNALLLYYYEKLSVKEIAEIQDTTEGTVKSRLNYARKAIKAKVEDYEEKTGTKLHSAAILPLLLHMLFGSEKVAMPVLTVPASLTAGAATTASTTVATATTAATTAAAKTAGVALGTKIAAAAVATSLVVAGTVGTAVYFANREDEGPITTAATTTEASILVEPTTSITTVETPSTIKPASTTAEAPTATEAPATTTEAPITTTVPVTTTAPATATEAPVTTTSPVTTEPPATEPTFSEGLEYILNDDGESYCISGYGSCTDKEVVIPESYEGLPVTRIGEDAFRDNDTIISITIPDSVTVIEAYAFYSCTYLTNVAVPNSVISIGDGAFEYCTSLPGITIPDSVTSIGRYAFWNCTSLTDIFIPGNVTSIGDHAFLICNNLESITVADENMYYSGSGNCLIETATKTLIVGCKNSVIPDDGSVTGIGDEAFENCESLTDLAIPSSVTSIGRHVFLNCPGLESITVADGNTVYHSSGNCLIETATKTLILGCKNSVIPDDGSVTGIGDLAFYFCTDLPGITIPDGVTRIGENAFSACVYMTEVTIPASVTRMDDLAFGFCFRLTDIIYNGTIEEWRNISKHTYWDQESSDYTVHCTDGDIQK